MEYGGTLENTSCKVSGCFCKTEKTMSEIKVEKVSKSYVLTKQSNTNHKEVRIQAHIANEFLTIMPGNNTHDKFEFRNSEPEIVRDIAELMLEAVKIIKEGK